MISKTQKWVFGSALAINIVALGAIGTVLHQRYVDRHTINLGTITVTAPVATSQPRLANNQVIDLGVITVTPSAAQLREVARVAPAEQPVAGLSDIEPMMQALDLLAPGQYLNSAAALDVLGTLAFEHADR